MTVHRAIQRMLRNPRDMMKFQATGRLPELANIRPSMVGERSAEGLFIVDA